MPEQDQTWWEWAAKERSVKQWEKDGVQFLLLPHPCGEALGSPDNLNGYCRFESRPVITNGYGEMLTWVPVHGGITFCDEEPDGATSYDYATGHYRTDLQLHPEPWGHRIEHRYPCLEDPDAT